MAAAAHDVLVPLVTQHAFPNCLASSLAGVEADYTAALGTIPDGLTKTQGVAVGQAAAAQILARRSGDGSDTQYLDSSYPQFWVGTPPRAHIWDTGSRSAPVALAGSNPSTTAALGAEIRRDR